MCASGPEGDPGETLLPLILCRGVKGARSLSSTFQVPFVLDFTLDIIFLFLLFRGKNDSFVFYVTIFVIFPFVLKDLH